MERKRKLPARAARVEGGPSKKRTSTPPDQSTHTPTPPVATPVSEEPLPKSIAPGKPLPTVTEAQPENLPSSQFQSIPESGVLPESLNRSRQKWISEGIFEKYWTKVTKKKGAPEQPKDNPPKDSMTKLGTCTITVEPHIFEAQMYAIKDMTPRAFPPPPHMLPRPPVLQYGPPGGVMPPPPPTPPPVQVKPAPIPQPTAQITTPSRDVNMSGTMSASHNAPLPHTNTNLPNGRPNPPRDSSTTSQYSPASSTITNPLPPPPPPQASDSPRADPVIQMLAERAATDPELKGLMRIVANGEASPEELKQFQNHIDELTKLQKARQAMDVPRPTPTTSQPPPPSASNHIPPATTPRSVLASSQPSHPPNNTPGGPTPPSAKAVPTPPVASSNVATQSPQYQSPQPQALRSKGPVPSTKPDISGVVFEFTGGNGDRYLFPKFSILEYPPGTSQVIASFLIIRKGSAADSPTYDPTLDYYQPVTIRLYAHQGRQLEALQKVVAPPDEVRRYMDDVMDKCTRAEYVLLAMRLPRDNDHEKDKIVEKEPAPSKEGDEMQGIQVNWATTNGPPPPAPQIYKETTTVPTEQQQYQKFINTVAAAV